MLLDFLHSLEGGAGHGNPDSRRHLCGVAPNEAKPSAGEVSQSQEL